MLVKTHSLQSELPPDRMHFVGGSDARVIMGGDEDALILLWQEKRGEAKPKDLTNDLVVQLGRATEALNLAWYERQSGHRIKDRQTWKRHASIVWMAATLDGVVEQTGAVFEAKFMLPWAFTEQAAAEKHMAHLQHNMLVVGAKTAVLSIVTGGGKWVEISVTADPVYQTALMYAERAFWRAVASGEPPSLFHTEPPRARIEAVKVADMTSSNAWASFAGLYRDTRPAHLEHERAKAELKGLMPEEAKEAIGHGVRAKRSKAGAISFDVLEVTHNGADHNGADHNEATYKNEVTHAPF